MNTTHTPGPWWRDDDGFIAAGANETYVTVASPNCSHDIDIDEREANARLIAAAPEMLSYLQWIERVAHDSKKWALRNLAREAIAKATGQTP